MALARQSAKNSFVKMQFTTCVRVKIENNFEIYFYCRRRADVLAQLFGRCIWWGILKNHF
jgi:hypothetical protein